MVLAVLDLGQIFPDSNVSFAACLQENMPSFSISHFPLILISFRFNNRSRASFSLTCSLSPLLCFLLIPSLHHSLIPHSLSPLLVPPSGLERGPTLSQIINLRQEWWLCSKKQVTNRWQRKQEDLLHLSV